VRTAGTLKHQDEAGETTIVGDVGIGVYRVWW